MKVSDLSSLELPDCQHLMKHFKIMETPSTNVEKKDRHKNKTSEVNQQQFNFYNEQWLVLLN